MKQFSCFLLILNIAFMFSFSQAQNTRTGLDRVQDFRSLFKGKRIGLITNHTAYNSAGKHAADIFLDMEDVQLSALFGPEHGIRGKADAGEKVESGKDPLIGIPIYSLYGKTRKPTQKMLENTDVLVFDIQDIGSRFYTYIWTMALAMEAAAENNIPFIVLDRPNPLNGLQVEGNILEREFSTFVGLYPIPVRHGMTTGELAQMFNAEGWLKNGVKADLKIIPLENWKRTYWFDQTGIKFIKPSPNMPNLETATVYPGICLLEGTNVSEGRGTLTPFLQFGAPWINGTHLIRALTALKIPGVNFSEKSFTPRSIKGASSNPKYKDRLCNGAEIKVTDRSAFRAYETGIRIVDTIHRLYPDSISWRVRHFNRLCGTAKVLSTIQGNGGPDSLFFNFRKQEKEFILRREPYLLYK